MTVSGTKTFELDVTDYIEEAFERCGTEMRTGYDLKTAKRSLNLMLSEWANRGLNQWTIARTTVTLTQGTRDYSLGADTIDVLSAVVRRSNTDYAMERVSRDADLNIPNKTTQGRPSQFFVDRQINPAVEQRTLDFLCKHPLGTQGTDRLAAFVTLRVDQNQLDIHACLRQTFSNPARLPASQGTGARANS